MSRQTQPFRPSIFELGGVGREHLMEIGDLLVLGRAFKARLDAIKKETRETDFEWYPYDTLSALVHMDRLLAGPHRSLRHLMGDGPVLDIGCGDGDLAFFLESLGCRVTAVDHESTNHNGLAGIRRLKDRLGSTVGIAPIDLDSQFELPEDNYGAVFLLGVLYHLKNPFYALEKLSRHARHMILGTALATPERTPGVPAGAPVAWLAGENEVNADETNFWIFTEEALRRLIRRAGWETLAFHLTGGADRRAFCLARSRYGLSNVVLRSGWHEPEESGWRWTEREFSIVARGQRRLRLDFYLPPEL
ncbi:MAG: class I SAM-dependent methyltransferase, partial [Bryobacteraceae bacterium]